MSNNLFINIGSREKLWMALGALAMVLAYAVCIGLFKNHIKQERRPPAEIITFENLPPTTKIEATLQNQHGIEPLTIQDFKIVLTPKQRAAFILPYKITAKLSDNNAQYRDIVWSVDSNGVNYAVTVDGFSPNDKVTFSLNDTASIKRMPLDWSGRLTLEALLIKAQDMKACVSLESLHSFSFCHVLNGYKGLV